VELELPLFGGSYRRNQKGLPKVSGTIATRVQLNFVAYRERQLLDWLCARLPKRMTPDHLTLIGILGACVVFAGYLGSRFDPIFLWLATLGSILHWFGDSLDGSLARHRRCERPKYGYFLDHSVDAFCNLIIVVGFGLSGIVRMDVALFALVGYYMLCMYAFLNNHVNGVLQLSFGAFGPTEIRLCMIAINIWAYVQGKVGVIVDGTFFSVFDFPVIGMGVACVGIFIYQMLTGIWALKDLEKAQQQRARDVKPAISPVRLAQMPDTNASILSK
jgi:phosphatidylglycerophosphate synthase